MRLHTNVITYRDIYEAARIGTDVWAEITEHGSRTHKRAFEVKLHGNGVTGGGYRDRDDTAATWDEWGIVINNLYKIDPYAVWGSVKRPVYSDADDFHWQTGDRFKTLKWEDQHKTRHAWRTPEDAWWGAVDWWGAVEQSCKCGAVRRTPRR